MKVVDIPIVELHEAPWNANQMEPAVKARLQKSLNRYGQVENLVVRGTPEGSYEVIGGNQRLGLLREAGCQAVPCVIVELDDYEARLLAQALNRIQGQDDLFLKAELIRKVLEKLPERDIMALLPETALGLQSLSSLGKEDMASYLENWDRDRFARLKHLQFQLTSEQLIVVEEALRRMLPQALRTRGSSPNSRGTALYLICNQFLEGRQKDER